MCSSVEQMDPEWNAVEITCDSGVVDHRNDRKTRIRAIANKVSNLIVLITTQKLWISFHAPPLECDLANHAQATRIREDVKIKLCPELQIFHTQVGNVVQRFIRIPVYVAPLMLPDCVSIERD